MQKKVIGLIASLTLLVLAVVFVVPLEKLENFREDLAAIGGSRLSDLSLTSLISTCIATVPQVSASWSASDNATSYVLERKYPWGGDWEITGETTSLSYTDATWESGYDLGIYSYRVRAISGRTSRSSSGQAIDIQSCVPLSVATTTPATPTPSPTPTPEVISQTPTPFPAPSPVSTPTPTPTTVVIQESLPTPTPVTIATSTGIATNTPPLISTAILVVTPPPVPIPPVTTLPIVTTISGNLIQNSSLETDANSDNIPDQWSKGGWGSNRTTYTYPTVGVDGARAASVSVISYKSGDAKWVFNKVAVTSGQTYRFSDRYLSTAATQVLLAYTNTKGVVSYSLLATLPASGAWQTYSGTFTVPSSMVSVSVFHLIASNGTLTIDGFSLSNTNVVVASIPNPIPIPTPAPTPTPMLVTGVATTTTTSTTAAPSQIKWGAFPGPDIGSAATFESLVGKQMNMQALFVGWGTSGPFPVEYGPSVRDKGKTLVIFWEQYGATLDDINTGKYDAYISQFAASAKSYGGPVILAPFHEMNGNWDPWDGTVGNNTPAKVIAAFKRIHDLFSGVSNVKFAWDVNNESVPDTTANAISAYYPGDAYVDYVAVDGFNFGNPWQSFSSVFGSAIAQVSGYGKPIYLLSVGSAAGSQKAAWITDAFTVQIPKYPQIAGWVWFNENQSAQGQPNWLVNSDSDSLAAFKSILP